MNAPRQSVHSEVDATVKDRGPSDVGVSICILNWNGSKLLLDCLQSLRDIRGSNRSQYEVIVIDNGSTDDSVEMVCRDFPEARLVTISKNISISAATNEGLRQCSGRYSLILNNDIVLQGNCLDQMSQFLDRNPKAGIVGARLLNPDGSTQARYYPRELPTVGSVIADLFWLNRNSMASTAGWDPNMSCRMEQVPGACMMVRAEVFKQIGLWDADFTCWYEDVDFCCRCLQSGWEIWYLSEAKVIHYGGSTVRKLMVSQQTIWRFHGLLRYSKKHFSGIQNTIVRFTVLATLFVRLPIAVVLCFWPKLEVRRAWKGAATTYLRLIGKVAGYSRSISE